MPWIKEAWEVTRSVGQSMGVVFKNLLRKPTTVSYPYVKRQLPDRQRATFALLVNKETGEEKCTACLICQNICPSQVISMVKEQRNNRGFAQEFTLDLGGCIFCELCVQACPQDAITMIKLWENSEIDRNKLFLKKENLLANQKYQSSEIIGSKIREMQTPPKVQPQPEEKKDA
jgi:NADH-quinone oxidoreductase subunit I